MISQVSTKRVEELEEFKGGGGTSHLGLHLEFALWGDPPPRVFFTVYEDFTFSLRVRNQPIEAASGFRSLISSFTIKVLWLIL